MALKNIVGQERALEILRGSIAKNRLAHAYLFTGEDGIGKKLTAINLAKMLNCAQNTAPPTHPSPSRGEGKGGSENLGSGLSRPSVRDRWALSSIIDCCDECPSCIKIDRKIHPDVHLISPENGQIKIGTIRKLGDTLSYKAFEGKWKIVIIDPADKLNQSAANAFLKTLEEPPHKSLLFLISSMPELIPSTIRSRCQRIKFLPVPQKKMEELLRHKYSKEGLRIHSKQAILISMLSGGRPGWALSDDLIERRDRSFDELKSLLGEIEENLWADRDSMEEWFDWIQLWLRDIAVFNTTGRAELLINQDKETEIKNISKKAELKDILKLSDTFYNIKDALRFNLNKQLTLYHTYLLLKKTFG